MLGQCRKGIRLRRGVPTKASQRSGHQTERERPTPRPRQERAGRLGDMNMVWFGWTTACVHACVHVFVCAHLRVGVGENREVSVERWPWIGSQRWTKRTLGVIQRAVGAHWWGFKQGRDVLTETAILTYTGKCTCNMAPLF